jgi:hypothetical protein
MAKNVVTPDGKPPIDQAEAEQTHSVRRDSEKRGGSGSHVPFVHKDKHDPEWDGSDVDFSHINTKRVLRKLDIRLIPNLALLYLLSFLDRGNIGNAKIQGLLGDLNLSGAQYNWCLTVFFFTYCKSHKRRRFQRTSLLTPSNMIRCLRTTKQSPSQTPSSVDLATHYHGRLGNCDDVYGYCYQLRRITFHSTILGVS